MSNHRGRHKVKSSTRRRLKRSVFGRDEFTCQECWREFDVPEDWTGQQVIEGLTLGHIIPAAWGGPMTMDNLKAECVDCNESRGDSMWLVAA